MLIRSMPCICLQDAQNNLLDMLLFVDPWVLVFFLLNDLQNLDLVSKNN